MKSSRVVLIISCCQIYFACVKSNIGHAPPGVNPDVYNNPQYHHPGGMPQGQQQYMAQPGMQPQYMGQAQMHQPQVPQSQFGGQTQYQPAPPQPHASQPHAPQPHAPHTHGSHGAKPVLHTGNIQQEKEHIAEHMEVPLDTSKMSEQELQFHYFKMHDNDNNNQLDGCELIKSLIHWHEQGHEQPGAAPGGQAPVPKLFSDEELVNLIDPILKMDDSNNDGYIDYTEFVRAQQKAAAAPAS
ncbi:hypothetical protein V9T40_013320 [Parthenolecanium corni]|uniref:EF-hand domain-containing protein n=1 Tax=Parthenolecanium corni TaxID=536013 RepID=A0AAN9TIW6_9HEMI